MIERRLLRQLEKTAGRYRHARVVTGWAVLWLLSALVAGSLLLANFQTGWYFEHAVLVVALAAGALWAIVTWLGSRSFQDHRWIAQQVEATYPELDACLLAAVDQQPDLPQGRYGFLQSRVIEKALRHAYLHAWKQVMPISRLLVAHCSNIAAFVLFLVSLAGLAAYAGPRETATESPGETETVDITRADFAVTIDPGDADVEKGTGLIVQARFQGPLPAEAFLVFEDGERAASLPMGKLLRDPIFGARIPEVTRPLSYRVEFGDQASDEFNVTVFEYPHLIRADARLQYPEYTKRTEELIEDVRRVSAVEGTALTLICVVNKELQGARLSADSGDSLELTRADGDELAYAVTFTLTESRRLKLYLTDDADRQNKQPPEFVINVLPNKPPDLKLVQPARDTQVSPIEELFLKANAWDDFGLHRIGLAYALGGETPTDLVLGSDATAKERVEVQHLMSFEEMRAEPDQLVSYHFWAEDAGPDGSVRRVESDLFFAEVRHFEEIFRQGQPPPGGQQQQQQQGNPQQAQQLAELQKQIINATWKVIRREGLTAGELSEKFADDVGLLVESQVSALQQAEQLAQQVEDSESLGHLGDAMRHMRTAFTELSRANDESSAEPLQPAKASEQEAYQALLKLRAREHQVVQQNRQQQQGSPQGGQNNRSQQQLDDLELNAEQNRYETERTAQAQQEQADRETRQVLNRLRELARRQSDLNERIKELQSALDQAKTEEERAEIERQLKRLQEEQQQILRDVDELRDRMDQPDNQERMAENREQLEETRENVRRSSQALEEGRVSRALASGSRAERELNDLRDEFRRDASGRFNEEMREMRDEARELDETQQELSNQIAGRNQPPEESPTKSLRDNDEREDLNEELTEQNERLRKLLDRMRDTVMEAEEAEPLLADQLYDTIRKAEHKNVPERLETTRRLMQLGFQADAKNEEQAASAGIRELREGVEKAANSVLGDETEALRRAQQELQRLTNEVDGEIERSAPPGEPSESDGNTTEEGQPREGDARERRENNGKGETEREQSGNQPSESDEPREGQQPNGDSPREAPNDSPDNQQQQSNQQQSSQQPPSSQQGNRPGNQPSGESEQPSTSSQRPQAGSPREDGQQGEQQQANRQSGGNPSRAGFDRLFNEPTGTPQAVAPIGGDDFLDWSDRLRDVEEMLDDPDLRAEAARIRDRARGFRVELKRHSKEPSWDLVEMQVSKPLNELLDRVAEELLKRTSEDALIPLDRDPVPPPFEKQVREYYERLGAGQ